MMSPVMFQIIFWSLWDVVGLTPSSWYVSVLPGIQNWLLQVNFAPGFIAPDGKATVEAVANHIDHIAKVAGKRQWDIFACFSFLNAGDSVGLGSDFDGIQDTPVGLEDVSKYPSLV